jgi:hypothetical protein
VREVLWLGGRFGFGGVGADVCDPVADECQEAIEAVGGQLAERDFRPQAGQVRLAVKPRDAQGVQSRGQSAVVLLAVVRGRPAYGLDADL